MKNIFYFLLMLFVFVACNSNLDSKNKILENELEKQKNELKELEKTEENHNSVLFNPNNGVDRNLVLCKNSKFLIRVDLMEDGELRYISWNLPKQQNDTPSLILRNGYTEKKGTMGGYDYIFRNAEWTYVIEDNQMGESIESIGIFLRLQQNEKLVLYSKMTDLK